MRGRNGRGKTSLLRIMAGLSSPAQGAVLCDGLALNRQGAEWRHRLLYVAHASALKEDLTVAECLSFSAALQGRRHSPEEIHAALAHWGISGLRQAPVRTLSQGQRRRTALARLALPHPASIWLLDEPFDALDKMCIRDSVKEDVRSRADGLCARPVGPSAAKVRSTRGYGTGRTRRRVAVQGPIVTQPAPPAPLPTGRWARGRASS